MSPGSGAPAPPSVLSMMAETGNPVRVAVPDAVPVVEAVAVAEGVCEGVAVDDRVTEGVNVCESVWDGVGVGEQMVLRAKRAAPR